MNLILFGFKGSGKTHFGQLLALKMHRPFFDLDALLVELTGKKQTVKEMYIALGSAGFRASESWAIQTLKNVENAIIAVGGGTVTNPENVEMLQKMGALIYLKTSAEMIKKRIFKEDLPAFFDKKDPEGSFLRMIHERDPIYRSIPARVVDTVALDEAGILAACGIEESPNGF